VAPVDEGKRLWPAALDRLRAPFLSVRVLAAKFGKRFTSRSKSPVVGPEKPPAPHSLRELKNGIRRYIRRRHARP